MLHKLVEYEKKEAIIEHVNNAMFLLKCPDCGKEHGSSFETSGLPDILWCWGIPDHNDWKEYKKSKKLTNADISKILGITTDSVKNQTQSNKPLPKWAISMLFEYCNR